jgi:hypothetical protein
MASKKRADYWAPRIHAEWRKSVEGIINVGRQLLAAKEACEQGEFSRLFTGSENAVSEPVPFTLNTAERLMRIARTPALTNSAHVQSLPQSWGTLYELTRLSDEQIAASIMSGDIRPEMTRAQAASLYVEPIDNGTRITQSQYDSRRTAATGIVRLPRWVTAMSRWADPAMYRYALGCLSIESDGLYATVVATDGRRMAVVSVPQSDGLDVRGPSVSQFLISVDDFTKAVKQVPPRWKPGTRLAEGNGDGSEHYITIEPKSDGSADIAAADGHGSPVTVNQVFGRYPSYRNVIDEATEASSIAGSLRCSPELLSDVSMLAKAAGCPSMTVTFTGTPSLVGVSEAVEGSTLRVVVMGMMGNAASSAPDDDGSDIAAPYAIGVSDDITPKVSCDVCPTLRADGKPTLVAVVGA